MSNSIDCAPFDPSIANASIDSFEFCDGYDSNCIGGRCRAADDSPTADDGFDRDTPCVVCDPATAAESWATTTAACNADDSGCTANDSCVAGTCTTGSARPSNCDMAANGGLGSDGLSCTVDVCVDAGGDDWNSTALSGAGHAYTCDNYLLPGVTDSGTTTPQLVNGTCLIAGVCYNAGEFPAGSAQTGTVNNRSCQVCDAFGTSVQSAGRYAWSPNTTGFCSDGFGCSIFDACTGTLGQCLGTTFDAICNDGNPCTTDRCDPYQLLAPLLFPIAAGAPAYPTSPFTGCTYGAVGHDGVSAVDVPCNDGDPCTFDDFCSDPSAGGTGGAGSESAAPGLCARGTDIECNDTNECTYNFCAGGTCQSAPIPMYFDGEFSGVIPRPLGEVATSPPDPSYAYSVSATAPYSVTNPVATPSDPDDAKRRCDLTDFCTSGICNPSGFCVVADDAAKCDAGAANPPLGWTAVDGDACSLPACDPAGSTPGHVEGCHQAAQTSGPCDSSELDTCDDAALSTCQPDGTCDVVAVTCAAPAPASDVAAVNLQCVTYACHEGLGSTKANQCIAVANDNTTPGFLPDGGYACDDGNACTVDSCTSDGGVGAFCQRQPTAAAPPLGSGESALCVHEAQCHAILGWNPSRVEIARVEHPASGVAAYGQELLGNVSPQLDGATTAAVHTASSNPALYADDLSNVPIDAVIACGESPDDPCTGPDICQANGSCLTGTEGDSLVTANDYCASPLSNTLCVLSGEAGQRVTCPIRLAASREAELMAEDAAFTLQMDIYYNANRASLLQAQDRPCILAAGLCLPEEFDQTLNAAAPEGSSGLVYPYNHQASFQPAAGANTNPPGDVGNYLVAWDTYTTLKKMNAEDPSDSAGGSGRIIMVNTSEPTAINRAYFSPPFDPSTSQPGDILNDAPAGTTGSLDPEAPIVFELVFELKADAYPNDPVLIHASEIFVTREDATYLDTVVWNGIVVTTPYVVPPPVTVGCATEGSPCDDGNDCTVADTCDASLGCVGTPSAEGTPCNGGNACQTGACDSLGACSGVANVANGTPCDDGELCTFGDNCQTGVCISGAYFEGVQCFDGQPCTFGEFCQAGACVHHDFCGACDPVGGDPCDTPPESGPEHLACAFSGPAGEEFDCWLYLGADQQNSANVAVGVEYTLSFDADELTLLGIYDKGLGSDTTPLAFADQGGFFSTNFASMASAIIGGVPGNVPANRHSLLSSANPTDLGAAGNPVGQSSTELRVTIIPTVFGGGGTVEPDAPLTNAYLTGFDAFGNPEFDLDPLPASNASSGHPEPYPGAYLRLRFRLDAHVSNDTPATVVYVTNDPTLAGDGDGIVPFDQTAAPLDYTLQNRAIVTEQTQ